MTINPWYI